MITRLAVLHTRSGLHCGTGQGLSDIDLPVARDPVTGHPIVPATSFKGCLRDAFPATDSRTTALFGEADSQGEAAARGSFPDVRLLCLPVPSYFGTFAFAASPMTLRFLVRELKGCGMDDGWPGFPVLKAKVARNPDDRKFIAVASDVLKVPRREHVLLSELDLCTDVADGNLAGEWAEKLKMLLFPGAEDEQKFFADRFAIVEDDVLNFLCETSLPVSAHNRIGENGVVMDGQLWFEEYVPAESIFFGGIQITDERRRNAPGTPELETFLTEGPRDLQIGGKATTGRGSCQVHFPQKGGSNGQ